MYVLDFNSSIHILTRNEFMRIVVSTLSADSLPYDAPHNMKPNRYIKVSGMRNEQK